MSQDLLQEEQYAGAREASTLRAAAVRLRDLRQAVCEEQRPDSASEQRAQRYQALPVQDLQPILRHKAEPIKPHQHRPYRHQGRDTVQSLRQVPHRRLQSQEALSKDAQGPV